MSALDLLNTANALANGSPVAALVTALAASTTPENAAILAMAIGIAVANEKLAPVSTVGYL